MDTEEVVAALGACDSFDAEHFLLGALAPQLQAGYRLIDYECHVVLTEPSGPAVLLLLLGALSSRKYSWRSDDASTRVVYLVIRRDLRSGASSVVHSQEIRRSGVRESFSTTATRLLQALRWRGTAPRPIATLPVTLTNGHALDSGQSAALLVHQSLPVAILGWGVVPPAQR